MSYIEEAAHFEHNETPFHLGFLPTEQSSELTKNLDKTFEKSVTDGVHMLQSVDRNVLSMAEKIFDSPEFAELVDALYTAVSSGCRMVFSGCGATGRLSILLEKMWRTGVPEYAGSAASIMTGGDYALVKSVESFEDYAIFGARQVRDLKMKKGDILVAITEGGETSSVLGTVKEFTSIGGKAFLLFNNPAEILKNHLERCREAITNPLVTVLDLSCGPMALAGSTRMQATTSEQLVVSCALEVVADRLYHTEKSRRFARDFGELLDLLSTGSVVEKIADQITFEADIYRNSGKVTYFADEYMLDLFTDTTERSPTFMLPGFKRSCDTALPEPWAFVRNPLYPAGEALRRALGNRELRCLEWTKEDYAAMGAPEKIVDAPPQISAENLEQIPVGNNDIPARYASGYDASVLFYFNTAGDELRKAAEREAEKTAFYKEIDCGCAPLAPTRLKIFEHLAVKLQWNTISTGTMVLLGRVAGNWMSCVAISNKKLIDRAIRLISELGSVDYHTACVELFRTVEENSSAPAVLRTLERIGRK
ncbi:MAG: sugar phosphate isomerase [Lentisphaeria bacterium]|nr:sugar phosphate isomerase [Lentisphaeria bacterium]